MREVGGQHSQVRSRDLQFSQQQEFSRDIRMVNAANVLTSSSAIFLGDLSQHERCFVPRGHNASGITCSSGVTIGSDDASACAGESCHGVPQKSTGFPSPYPDFCRTSSSPHKAMFGEFRQVGDYHLMLFFTNIDGVIRLDVRDVNERFTFTGCYDTNNYFLRRSGFSTGSKRKDAQNKTPRSETTVTDGILSTVSPQSPEFCNEMATTPSYLTSSSGSLLDPACPVPSVACDDVKADLHQIFIETVNCPEVKSTVKKLFAVPDIVGKLEFGKDSFLSGSLDLEPAVPEYLHG